VEAQDLPHPRVQVVEDVFVRVFGEAQLAALSGVFRGRGWVAGVSGFAPFEHFV
jgi:hypothetical protein